MLIREIQILIFRNPFFNPKKLQQIQKRIETKIFPSIYNLLW